MALSSSFAAVPATSLKNIVVAFLITLLITSTFSSENSTEGSHRIIQRNLKDEQGRRFWRNLEDTSFCFNNLRHHFWEDQLSLSKSTTDTAVRTIRQERGPHARTPLERNAPYRQRHSLCDKRRIDPAGKSGETGSGYFWVLFSHGVKNMGWRELGVSYGKWRWNTLTVCTVSSSKKKRCSVSFNGTSSIWTPTHSLPIFRTYCMLAGRENKTRASVTIQQHLWSTYGCFWKSRQMSVGCGSQMTCRRPHLGLEVPSGPTPAAQYLLDRRSTGSKAIDVSTAI